MLVLLGSQPGQLELLVVLVMLIHLVVRILQLDIAGYVAVVVIHVAILVHHPAAAGLVMVTTTTTRSSTAPVMVMAAGFASGLFIAIRRRVFRAVFPILLDSFVFRPSILEPDFDLRA